MSLMLAVLAGSTIVLAPGTRAAATSPDDKDVKDIKAITQVFEALQTTWNAHDMRAHASLYHDDTVWIAWTGQVYRGAADFEAGLARLHETIFRKSVHDERIEELTLIAPDVAIVRGYGTVIGNEPTPEKRERYRILLVMTRREGAWKIGWGQKTRFLDRTPDPTPPPGK